MIRYIPIVLSAGDIVRATEVGHLRHLEAQRRKRKDQHGGEGVEIHILGACGELAFHRYLFPDRVWIPSINTFKRGYDVGYYQVRTRRLFWHELIIRDDDLHPNGDEAVTVKRYALVTGPGPTFVIVGWYWSHHVLRYPDWRKPHGDRELAYFVPQDVLAGWNKNKVETLL